MLQSKQPVEVYKLATLSPCQVPRVAYSFTQEEHAATGGWTTKHASGQSQSGPVIAEKPADVSELGQGCFVEKVLWKVIGFIPKNAAPIGSSRSPFPTFKRQCGQTRCSSSIVYRFGHF